MYQLCILGFLFYLAYPTTSILILHAVPPAAPADGLRPAPGLSFSYYRESCPRVYDIVHERVKHFVDRDPSEAAGILRILFHDCFVQGCDASVLLQMPTTEQTALPNNKSLRATSLKIFDDIKEAVESACPETVSCADIIALAARESVYLVGGPFIPMATGRRDGRSAASNQTVISNIPAPTFNFSQLQGSFGAKGLDINDLVALSGGHTIGRAHCRFIDLQLSPTVSSDLDQSSAKKLAKICLPSNLKMQLTAHLDPYNPDHFDNSYFQIVLAKKALFHSDASLLSDRGAKSIVENFAESKENFFKQFSLSLFRMSQLHVLTGNQGEVRRKCTVAN